MKKVKVEFINIETPWCSAEEAFERFEYLTNLFKIRHNVIKSDTILA